MPSTDRRLRRLRSLRAHDLRLLAEALLCFPVVRLWVRRSKVADIQQRLAARPARWRPAGDDAEVARRLGWLVEVAARWGPWRPNCLHRSLVLWWFLQRHGVRGQLRIGVRRRPAASGQLDFHAWVERDGELLNERGVVTSQYAVFDRPIVPRGARLR